MKVKTPTILSDGLPYYPTPAKVDQSGWSRGAIALHAVLLEKGNDRKRDVFILHVRDVMSLLSLKGLKSLKTLQVARDELVRRGIIKAELLPGMPKGLWRFTLCSHVTKVPYSETRVDVAGYRARVNKIRADKEASLVTAIESMEPKIFPSDVTLNGERFDWHKLGEDRVRKCCETLLPDREFESGPSTNWYIPCLFHNDTKPSLSIEKETGRWNCKGCGAKGNIFTLAEMLRKCAGWEGAAQVICDILGKKRLPSEKTQKKLRSDYFREHIYRTPHGKRHARVRLWKINGVKEGSTEGRSREDTFWLPNLKWTKDRWLYNCDLFRDASLIIKVEGEKNADRLMDLNWLASDGTRIIATTNMFGAMAKWEEAYSWSLVGK